MVENNKHIHLGTYSDSAETRALSWIEANLFLFQPTLLEYIESMLAYSRIGSGGLRSEGIQRAFNMDLRLLEEMPVCTFWSEWSKSEPIPSGYKVVKGSVFLLDKELFDHENQTRRADHRYLEALDGSDVIVDHCVAQFHKRASEELPKGERLKVLKSKAGDLIKTFTLNEGNTHSFLIGSRSQIEERIGMRYDTFPRYES